MNTIFKKGLRSWSKIKTVVTYRKLIRSSIKTFRPVLKITNKRMMKYVSMVTIFTMVFGLVSWSTDFNSAYADVTTLFSDNFDQSSSGLTNDWDNVSGGGSGSRVSVSDDSLAVGVVSKGLLLEGEGSSHSNDPDETAEHEFATQGFATLHISYSRTLGGVESDDSFVAQYSLDDGPFVSLEDPPLNANQAHSVVTFDIDNSNRNTKLLVRFLMNGTSDNDEVGIDNFSLTGEGVPLFYDGFESNDFGAGSYASWTTEETPTITQSDSNSWTNDNTTANGHSGNLDGVNTTNPDDAMYRTVDTTGYQDIKLRFARKVDNLAAGESLKVYVSTVTGDPSWDEIYSTENDSFDSELVSLPDGADNNANTKIRFELNGSSSGDDAYIDDVVVWGDETPEPTGSISGYKFNDLNGNGSWDDGEPALSGWTITLSNDDEATTDEDGYYTFDELEDDEYTVCEVMPDDEDEWTQTMPSEGSDCDGTNGYSLEISEGDEVTGKNFGNVQYGSITIQKITDPEEINPDNEAGGFEFTVTGQEDSVVESGDSTTYNDLVAGTYDVQEVVPEGWSLGEVSCVYDDESVGQETENGKTVVLGAGDDVTCTFTNTKLGTITVWKYADPFGGSFDFELQGPTSGETTIIAGEEGGSYVFENLEPGEYSLSEDVPEGWTSDGGSCGEDGSPSSIELSAGGNVSCVFNNTEYGSISGRKFEDLNANHEDDEDPGLEWDINLYQLDDEEWSFVTSEESDSETGNYMFDNLLPGTYKVCETSEEDWTQSYPESGSDCEDSYGYEVVVSAGQDVLDQDFGNYEKGSITGYKFEDMNGDGGWGEESVLSGWTIYIDANGDGFLNDGEISATTDENGYYSFTNLEPGDYIIREVSQDGWVQKLPSDGNGYEITLTSGEVEDGYNFGNFKKPIVTVYKYNDLDNGGDLDKEEPALENWTMALGRIGTRPQPEQPAGPDNKIPIEIVAMSLTGVDGSVRLTVDQPGNYKAFEAQQDGWSVTSPGHIESFFDITYDLDAIAIGDPDFDLLSIGDPDFDLLRSSFFDVFVDISGQNINSDNQERPLIFLNHLPSPTPTPTPTPSETPTSTPEPSETPTPTPEPENNGGGGGGGGGNPGVIIDGPGANPPSGGGGTVAGASTTPTPTPTPTPSSTPNPSGSTTGGGSSGSGSSGGGEPSPTPEVTEESLTPTPSETPAPSESPLPDDSNLFAEFLNSLPDSWVWLLPLFVLIALFFIWLSRRS
ncbi:MAG: SdrD B-like domain-containing protein [bacterium]|nr:SdrD B-like domain-containing protein [bacterium]